MKNKFHLSKRLQHVKSYIKPDAVLLDIGSDHAYLPIACIKEQQIKKAFATEVADGPLRQAKSHIYAEKLDDRITLLKGNGFAAIASCPAALQEVDTVTICGMGGQLIASIIEKGAADNQIPNSAILILQPNNEEELLRKTLSHLDYQIINEGLVEDHGFIYEVICAIPTKKPLNYSETELLFGPVLLKDRSRLFLKKWRQKEKVLEEIAESLMNAQADSKVRQDEVHNDLKMIRKVIE